MNREKESTENGLFGNCNPATVEERRPFPDIALFAHTPIGNVERANSHGSESWRTCPYAGAVQCAADALPVE
jgi:hypothetical protein